MATVLCNPTNEEMTGMYGGEETKFSPYPQKGSTLRVDGARARHILNQLGCRGLIELEFGDEGDKLEAKRLAGIERNIDFKKRCIERYNQDNARREDKGWELVQPPKHIIDYSKELGVKLYEPYTAEDGSKAEISKLIQEKTGLEQKLAKLMEDNEKAQKAQAELMEKLSVMLDQKGGKHGK